MSAFYQNREEEYSVTTTLNNTYPLHLHRQVEMIYVKAGSFASLSMIIPMCLMPEICLLHFQTGHTALKALVNPRQYL